VFPEQRRWFVGTIVSDYRERRNHLVELTPAGAARLDVTANRIPGRPVDEIDQLVWRQVGCPRHVVLAPSRFLRLVNA
jgi:hypothetical protein